MPSRQTADPATGPAGSDARDLRSLIELASTDPHSCLAGYVDRVIIADGILAHLAEGHARGHIHGDLRPELISISIHGVVTIEGWGASPGGVPEAPYRAPELAGGATASAASDLYAFGAILLELLTAGRWDGGGRHSLQVPDALLATARKALAPEPQLRWQDAAALRSALRGWLDHRASAAGSADVAVSGGDPAPRRFVPVIVLSVLAAVLLTGWLAWLTQGQREVAWRTEREWLFPRGASTAGLESSSIDVSEQRQLESPATPGLVLPKGHTVWLREIDSHGDVKLSIDAEWTSRVDGLELILGVPRVPVPKSSMAQPGYTCQFGGLGGSQTFLSASLSAGMPQRPAPIAIPFEPRRTYRLELERRGEAVRMLVDGKPVWEQHELIPIGDSSFRWLALRAWTDVKVHRLSVGKPLHAPQPGPLSAADGLAGSGQLADAFAAYQDALRLALTPAQTHQALAKAHAVASRLPSRSRERLQLLARSEREIPAGSPYLIDVLQSEARCLWSGRDWPAALAMVQRVQALDRRSRCALSVLELRIGTVPEAQLHALLKLIAAGPAVSHLRLNELGLSDISALRGLRLSSLEINDNLIADLRPLAGMPLRQLNCSNNRIADLAPLADMPLIELNAAFNLISDLSPLSRIAPESLTLNDNRIGDLAPIAKPGLQRLAILRNPIVSLSPLAACGKLSSLALSDAPLHDLTGVPPSLADLSISNCPISDLQPLSGCRLTSLRLSDTLVADAAALPRGTLTKLSLDGTQIASLASLKGHKLDRLDLSRTPLASLVGYGELSLGRQSILLLDGSAITSLAPLAEAVLDELHIAGTQVRDLSPLASCTVSWIKADGIPAEDPSPLARIHTLNRLNLWRSGVPAASFDALADQLERTGRSPALVESLRIQAAATGGDWRRLRAMARRIGSSDRLITNIRVLYPEALALAAQAGARLPCFTDRNDLLALYTQANREWSWAGLHPSPIEGETPAWDDGRSDPLIKDLLVHRPTILPAAWILPSRPFPLEAALWPISKQDLEQLRYCVTLQW